MRIGVLIPTRGDRPLFLEQAKRMIAAQTMQPDVVHIVNHKPLSEKHDIVERYMKGVNFLFEFQNCDVVLAWEDDDWYGPFYIQNMIEKWQSFKMPHLFGLSRTVYYNLSLLRYKNLYHDGRASMFNTLISKDAEFEWPPLNEKFLDIYLWKTIRNSKAFLSEQLDSIGIKHGTGLCVTKGHINNAYIERNSIADHEMLFLKSHVDEESFNFYKSIHERLKVAA